MLLNLHPWGSPQTCAQCLDGLLALSRVILGIYLELELPFLDERFDVGHFGQYVVLLNVLGYSDFLMLLGSRVVLEELLLVVLAVDCFSELGQ